MLTYPTPIFEFHISRQARDHYQFDELIFGQAGNVIFANFHAARVFATKINQKRDVINFPENVVRAGQINAMGLIDEILHMVVQLYRQQIKSQVMQEALDWIMGMLGKEEVDHTLLQFIQEFPPIAVYRKEPECSGLFELSQQWEIKPTNCLGGAVVVMVGKRKSSVFTISGTIR